MKRLPFSLIVITDWALDDLLSRVEAALEAGPGIAIQHRHPGATDRRFYEEGIALERVCRAANAKLFINGRLDIALALNANLHCTTRSLKPLDVRDAFSGLISCVVHDDADSTDGADLALVSPVFRPGSKPDDTRPQLGVAGFERLARRLPCPAFALGGMETTNAGSVKAAGVAVIASVLHASDPKAAARSLLQGQLPLKAIDGTV
ncbi:MAG: thiamine phosphate synthase [Archangiaceae bacterium]|nr:thiamine phosphate synthase [Archangiaceae bacterium]